MQLRDFIYRQKSRLQYHTASDDVKKTIAEINRYKMLVQTRSGSYYIPQASIEIPKGLCDHLFFRFDLFLQNMHHLNGHYIVENDKLFFAFDDFKFQIVSANELFIIDEIYFKQCYNFKVDRPTRYHVIDIGMNVGLASMFFANKLNVDRVFAFEPILPSFTQAMSNFDENRHLAGKIIAHNFGLGKGDRRETAFYDPFASGKSAMQLCDPDEKAFVAKHAIMIKDAYNTISAIISDNPSHSFCVKIDCEGAEYEIMESLCEGGLPPSIKVILLEWHGASPDALESKILSQGFQIITTRSKNNLGLMYAFR